MFGFHSDGIGRVLDEYLYLPQIILITGALEGHNFHLIASHTGDVNVAIDVLQADPPAFVQLKSPGQFFGMVRQCAGGQQAGSQDRYP